MLKINFLSRDINDEKAIQLAGAVNYELNAMTVQLKKDEAAKLLKQIENKNERYTEKEVAAFSDKLLVVESEIKACEEAMKELDANYSSVIAHMTEVNAEGYGNDPDVVKTVLRVLAACENSKLMKYAIIPTFTSAELYDALENIHVLSKAKDDGSITMSTSVKDSYKKADAELDRIMKVNFSLPFATPYTEKIRVKMTAEDKKLLNECYVTGFSNRFEDEENSKIFKARSVRTLVSKKIDKTTKKETVNYSKLATVICNIVVAHYAAK